MFTYFFLQAQHISRSYELYTHCVVCTTWVEEKRIKRPRPAFKVGLGVKGTNWFPW